MFLKKKKVTTEEKIVLEGNLVIEEILKVHKRIDRALVSIVLHKWREASKLWCMGRSLR